MIISVTKRPWTNHQWETSTRCVVRPLPQQPWIFRHFFLGSWGKSWLACTGLSKKAYHLLLRWAAKPHDAVKELFCSVSNTWSILHLLCVPIFNLTQQQQRIVLFIEVAPFFGQPCPYHHKSSREREPHNLVQIDSSDGSVRFFGGRELFQNIFA